MMWVYRAGALLSMLVAVFLGFATIIAVSKESYIFAITTALLVVMAGYTASELERWANSEK